DHAYFVWHEPIEPAEQENALALRRQLEGDGYQLWGEAMVNDEPGLAIYKLTPEPLTPQTFAAETMAARFDAALSGPFWERDGPVAAPDIAHPLDFRFGDP